MMWTIWFRGNSLQGSRILWSHVCWRISQGYTITQLQQLLYCCAPFVSAPEYCCYPQSMFVPIQMPMRILESDCFILWNETYVCWDQRCCEVDGASRAGHTPCFRLSRDLTCPGTIVCLLSGGGPGFVSDVFGLATYILYKRMLSSPKMTRVRTMALSGRASWNTSLIKNLRSNYVD